MSFLADFVTGVIRPQCAGFQTLFGRVIADYDDVEARAEAAGQAEWNRLMAQPVFDDNDGDMGAAADRANEVGQNFYDAMFPLGQSLQNLFTVGMFHSFEQQLFLLHQVSRAGGNRPRSMLGAFTWINDRFGIDPNVYPMTPRLNELRHAANVIKHTEGESARELRALRAELFQHPGARGLVPAALFADGIPQQPLAGESIYVTRQDFDDYAAQVDAFWTTLAADFAARQL